MLAAVSRSAPAVEPTTIADLARAWSASRAMDQGDPSAHLYRAGRFDGYLLGLAEALSARGEVCLPACTCEFRERIDGLIERDLAEPALDRTLPARPWLADRLLAAFPCARR